MSLFALDVSPAPSASDNDTVLLWLVGILVAALVAALGYLKNKVSENEIKCLKDAEMCRAEAASMHIKIETLLTGVVAKQADQTHAVVEALNRVCDEIGSGKHPKVKP